MKLTEKLLILLCFMIALNISFGQTLKKRYGSCWGDTDWVFEFKANGKYTRTSTGHFGNTVAKGRYKIQNDTLVLKSGYKKTYGTVNEFYKIANDTLLIDMDLGYGYSAMPDSIKRILYVCDQFKYPLIQAYGNTGAKTKKEIEEVLNLALNNAKVKQYYHFKEFPERKLLIANYHRLDANINVGNKQGEFLPFEKIQEEFYVKIWDIELFDDLISIELEIPVEGVKIRIDYTKKQEHWEESYFKETEK